jgi:spore germination protein GerM
MKKTLFFGLVITVFFVVTGIFYFMGRSGFSPDIFAGERSVATVPVDISESAKSSKVHLYFADRNSAFLIAEQRTLGYFEDVNRLGRAIIDALIIGPNSKKSNLVPTLPKQTKLRTFFITSDNVAYVDFTRAVADSYPGGCNLEMLTIYSVVNTLVLNSEEIDAVKIMIQGKDVPTLAGHIAALEPFKANMLLVR